MTTEVRELNTEELDQATGGITEGGCIPPLFPPMWPPYQIPTMNEYA